MEEETRFLSCKMDACETSFRNAVRSVRVVDFDELSLSLLLMPLFEACNLVLLLLLLHREIRSDDGC